MNKGFFDYRVLILDMDGTLYYQLPVRICMLFSLVFYYLLRITRIKELSILSDYRKVREKRMFAENDDFEHAQYQYLADKHRLSVEHVKMIIAHWMHNAALKAVRFFRDKKIIALVKKYQAGGGIVIVYSDYPVDKKLKMIDLKPDFQFYSGDSLVRCMKPESEGLKRIVAVSGFETQDVLFIGDRYEKDGKCAESAGIDFLILKQDVLSRKMLFKSFLHS